MADKPLLKLLNKRVRRKRRRAGSPSRLSKSQAALRETRLKNLDKARRKLKRMRRDQKAAAKNAR